MTSQRGVHQVHSIHFFKVILESNLRNGELRVPKSFVKKHWQGMANPVFLCLPNGTEWKVYWMKRDGDVWFRNGWKEFAQYLSLDVAQFLMFQHHRKSHFKVVIFDKDALEIKYPSSSKVADKKSLEVDESECSLEIVPSFVGKRQKCSSLSSPSCNKLKIIPKEEPECYSDPPGFDIDDMSKALLDKVKTNFKSENNYFICRIQKTYTERDLMHIPKDFCNNLHAKDGDATLSVKESTWDVRIKFSYKQASFCEGWKKFFQDNDLKFGDVCAFVQDKYDEFSFEVVIFHLGDNCSTLFYEDQKELSHKPASSTPRHAETSKANSRCMSKNDFTIYFKHTTPYHSAPIPIDFIRNIIIHNGKQATLRFENKTWPVKVLYYPHYSSAKFSVGWLDFVRDFDLKKGDACHFKIIDEDNLVFQVSISRGEQ